MSLLIDGTLLLLILIGLSVVVKTKNVIHAAYGLGLILVSIAGIYVTLNAELLAVVQLLLYAGGVVILLVFGVMITRRKTSDGLVQKSTNSVTAAVLAIVIFSGLVYLFSSVSLVEPNQVFSDAIGEFGIAFLTEHIVAFELIAFILLVALVGASYLSKMSSDE